MCYGQPQCGYFWFNPMTGADGCRKPKYARCPDEPDETEFYQCKCGEVIEVFPYTEDHEIYCSTCGRTGCAEPIEEE